MMDFSHIFQNKTSINLLIESLPEGVVIINKSGKILLVNKKTTQLFGYSKEELVDQSISILIPSRFQSIHDTHIKGYFANPKIRAMGDPNSKLYGRKKDGSELAVEISLSFVHDNKETIGVAFITDISARVYAENELKKRNLELDAYAHTIAHELHSQLNSIIGFSQVLLNNVELAKEKHDSYLDMIITSGYKMNSIVREMLLFASLKKEEILRAKLSMNDIVQEALKRISHTERQKAQISIDKNFEVSVGYGPWIEEVWYNYIYNAIKYGGTPPKIEIGSSKADNGYSKFWVKDNGIGLSKKQCDLIFVDPTKLGHNFIKGHGLGLSIVKRIVKRLDGWVQVESTPNLGSTFSFYLPTSLK